MSEFEKMLTFYLKNRMTEDQIKDLGKGNFYFQEIRQGNNNYTLQFGMY